MIKFVVQKTFQGDGEKFWNNEEKKWKDELKMATPFDEKIANRLAHKFKCDVRVVHNSGIFQKLSEEFKHMKSIKSLLQESVNTNNPAGKIINSIRDVEQDLLEEVNDFTKQLQTENKVKIRGYLIKLERIAIELSKYLDSI